MKNVLLLIVVILTSLNILTAGEIVWASRVLDFSSEYTSTEASAKGVLGKPNVLANYGYSPAAWMPRPVFGRELESITVEFSKPIFAEQVVINENYFSGTVAQICLYDSADNPQIVFENKNTKLNAAGFTSNYLFPKTKFKVAKLVLKVKASIAYKGMQIDAIGISDSRELVKVEINNATGADFKDEPENLGTGINSEAHEISPIISQDGKTIYFVREGYPENLGSDQRQDIWKATADKNGKFSQAENIGYPINNESHNYIVSLSPDGNTMLVGNSYNPDGTLSIGASISHKEGNKWSYPKPIQIDKNIIGANVSYNLAANQKVMFMSAERSGGFGKEDIYVMFLQNDSVWSEPINLGDVINSPCSEVSPYLASDMTTLYFSTDGRPGYGSVDFFMTRRLDETWTKWSEPQNLGPKLNSAGWDAYFTVPASGKYAYYVSTANSYGLEDVFRIKLPDSLQPQIVVLVSGRVLNAKDQSPVAADIIYELLGKNENAGRAVANPETGEYQIALPAGKLYGFLAEAKDYLSINENLDLRNIDYYQEVYRNLFLVPVKKGAVVRINNIFFETGKYELLAESQPELDRLVKFLENNKEYELEISGHTDDIGSNASNITLSKNRANSVAAYLQAKGIEKKRIKTKSYGKSKPIVPNDSDENRAQNRRVEFKLL